QVLVESTQLLGPLLRLSFGVAEGLMSTQGKVTLPAVLPALSYWDVRHMRLGPAHAANRRNRTACPPGRCASCRRANVDAPARVGGFAARPARSRQSRIHGVRKRSARRGSLSRLAFRAARLVQTRRHRLRSEPRHLEKVQEDQLAIARYLIR